MLKRTFVTLVTFLAYAPVWAATGVRADAGASDEQRDLVTETAPLGEGVERELPMDVPVTEWKKDEGDDSDQGDRIEKKKVLEQEYITKKLRNVVPAIHFESGEAQIPESYVALIREALDGVKNRVNVRLHFVGHTDDQKLSGRLKEKYGDNVGLSRERAGITAEYFQRALDLPAESISYEGVGDTVPVASNGTAEGRRQNRRVEVEVWYDEVSEKMVEKEVVVSNEINRVKVCRVETVCKLRYKAGHSKRARIKNLIAPLHYDEESPEIPPEFLEKIRQAMHNLRGKGNVVVKFIGHTDNVPLEGRQARIYGTHLGLSKARARRVALAVKDALNLPTAAVDSDGMGDKGPVASNATEKGRALNRRIEVEFWHDDPLQELPDEPQLCPESDAAETVTRVYDPPSGTIKPVYYENGDPVVGERYAERLGRLMGEISDKTNVRLRFVGYTSNERLDRRTARVYGDDIGLSAARAKRAAEKVKELLSLDDKQIEYEGRGYVQSDDVVNSGFVESDQSRVEVQVVYDDLASLDDTDGMEITRLTREVDVRNPFALNLMRISVDGKPVSDPGKNSADIQRCTDVALDKADIRFKFDNLDKKPRLNVAAWPRTVRYQDDPATDAAENLVRFSVYTNFPSFIEKSEIRIFGEEQSERDKPLAVIPVSDAGRADWQVELQEHAAPGRELKYLVRVYDSEGRFDETESQILWVVDEVEKEHTSDEAERELLAGYGENRLRLSNIPISGGSIKVLGRAIPEGHSVWVAGHKVPVDPNGEFAAEQIIPAGMHTVEVAVLDDAGNGELFLRDLELKKNDWFYVGIADITAARDKTNGPAELVTQDKAHYDNDLSVDGRLAFYTHGKFAEDWRLTASADTREGPVDDIFSNFMEKSPDALFRRIDPDYYYPTFGDDSTVEETAPTLGKFYIKATNDRNYGLWGNFKIGYHDSDLAQVDRGLYGANLHYQSLDTTDTGEARFMVDGFAAEPGTVASREDFRGTGGSLYFLRHQDILIGSERVRIEIRDKDSGIVTAVKNLTPALDYDIDYLQGRVMLSEPLQATVDDGSLVDSGSLSGNRAFLVVRYEYSPGFDDINTLAVGGRTHYWVNDSVKLGLTSSKSEEADSESKLAGADLTLRKSAESWLKMEVSQTEGPGTTTLGSNTGGFDFNTVDPLNAPDTKAGAYRLEASVGFGDFIENGKGRLSLYRQELDAGYSAPGLISSRDVDQYGGAFIGPIGEKTNVRLTADKRQERQGLTTSAEEVNVDYALSEHWTLSSGVRHDNRSDDSPVVPLTQKEGERSDVKVQGTYDSRTNWRAYGFLQDTASTTGNREENGRVGVGGDYRVNDRFKLRAEASDGDLGTSGKLGADYLYSDRTTLYLTYGLENERTDNGVRARRGDITTGFKTRYSDSASVYLEEKYTYGDVPTGLIHSTGVDLAPNERWNLGASLAFGTLQDYRTAAETRRKSVAFTVGYGFDAIKVASAVEYLKNDMENPDGTGSERTTWLTKNSLKYQLTPDWRLIGKLNYSDSNSSLGEFYDGNFTEAVVGYGFRPVNNDRLNALAKYTYFYNVPTVDQVTVTGTASQFIQKSHIGSLDLSYGLSPQWTLGGKYAHRVGQVSQDRVDPEFFENSADLYVLRADWHFIRRWDALVEGRMLDLPDAGDRRSGALVALYRHFGNHVKFGAGYNFTDFSDDLTDLDYDSQGFFLNFIGKI